MQYYSVYDSPLGKILLYSNSAAITGLYFPTQIRSKNDSAYAPDLPILLECQAWLDAYFSGRKPDAHAIPILPSGTDFQKIVWSELLKIPYGCSTTYGTIAKSAAAKMGKQTMSAQAVGGAVGRNPISILIPCHRVLGADGSLTGYAGGIDKKIQLLKLEEIPYK